MKTTGEIGLKIGAKTREYYRYTGNSAEAEKAGRGASHVERFQELAIREQTQGADANPGAQPDGREKPNSDRI